MKIKNQFISKLCWLLLSFLLLFSKNFSIVLAKDKIGFVDIKKIYDNWEIVKKAKADFEKKTEEIEKDSTKLKKLEEDYNQKKNVLTEESRQKKEKEIEELRVSLRTRLIALDEERQKIKKELIELLVKKLENVLKQIAEREGYSLIIDKTTVLYAAEGVDLTDKVIEEFNKSK